MNQSPAIAPLSNEEKISAIAEMMAEAKTFSGVDLKPMAFHTPWKNENEDYLRINHRGVPCYLPKTQRAVDLDLGDKPNSIAGFRNRFDSPYDARGVEMNFVNDKNLRILKEVFGDALTITPEKDRPTHTVSMFTHIDKKGFLERGLEKSFTAAGAAVALPGAAIGVAAASLAYFAPGAIGMATRAAGPNVVVGGLMGAGACMVAGAALVGVPEMLDNASDKLNGDERKSAMRFAESKINGLTASMVTQVSENVPVLQAAPVIGAAVTPALRTQTMGWLGQTFGMGKNPEDKPKSAMRPG